MKSHSEKLGLQCVKQAQAKWGKSWKMLSPELQEGQVCCEIVSILLAQDSGFSKTKPEDVLTHILAVARAAILNQLGDTEQSPRQTGWIDSQGRP